ncbi:zinc finger, AN1-type domain [Balamuthia mandrillaris]
MEFPDLGKQCSKAECKQLDFLPFKCEHCAETFCLEHRKHWQHDCPSFEETDVRAPVCPLCSQPVDGFRRGGSVNNLDQLINQHIEGGCKSAVQERRRQKRCEVRGCKVVELMPVHCSKCQRQYCLRHRLAEDHKCQDVLRRQRERALRKSMKQLRLEAQSHGSSTKVSVQN